VCLIINILLDGGTPFVAPYILVNMYRKKGFLDVHGYVDLWHLCN